jgi:CheY-like chemotaxis protein
VGPDGPDRDFIVQVLAAAGLELAAATEAEIHAVDDWVPPALVVLDDPPGRGKDARQTALGALRRHPSLIGVPVLIVSQQTDIDSFTGAITGGAAAYLPKPPDAEELAEAARRLSGWKAVTADSERRRRIRRPLLMRVTVEIRSQKRKIPGQMVDAAGGGCQVEVAEEIKAGELVRIVLHSHEDSTHVALGCEVRWHRVNPDGRHAVGLKFTGTTALLAGKLLGFASTGTT